MARSVFFSFFQLYNSKTLGRTKRGCPFPSPLSQVKAHKRDVNPSLNYHTGFICQSNPIHLLTINWRCINSCTLSNLSTDCKKGRYNLKTRYQLSSLSLLICTFRKMFTDMVWYSPSITGEHNDYVSYHISKCNNSNKNFGLKKRPTSSQVSLKSHFQREDIRRKSRLLSSIARKWGGLPMPEFCGPFLQSKSP